MIIATPTHVKIESLLFSSETKFSPNDDCRCGCGRLVTTICPMFILCWIFFNVIDILPITRRSVKLVIVDSAIAIGIDNPSHLNTVLVFIISSTEAPLTK